MQRYSIIKGMAQEVKPKLLVVDDEIDQCLSLQSYFSKRNFLVLIAATGEKAIGLIKENNPDLILLDMKLSGDMSGKDVLQIIRQNDKKTKVILITGDVLSNREIQEITDLGIVEFLHKPVAMQTLEGIIKKALQARYPKEIRFEEIKPKQDPVDTSLRRINHELANITNDIVNKCELYLLDTEEGLNKTKNEKERLDEAIGILKSVLKQAERLTEIVKKLSSLVKKEL